MPYESPSSLTDDEIYAVAAHLLHLDGIVGEDDMLDQESLPEVEMPNRDGFVPDDRPAVVVRPPAGIEAVQESASSVATIVPSLFHGEGCHEILNVGFRHTCSGPNKWQAEGLAKE